MTVRTEDAALILGTAQLGAAYGATNRIGTLDDDAARALIRHARRLGYAEFDTARGYGDSERRLGLALAQDPEAHIVTKLSPLSALTPETPLRVVEADTRASLATSREALGRRVLPAVLLHRAHHLTAWDGVVWDVLLDERDDGGILTLGVSVQTPDELDAALRRPQVRHVQMPFNLLDWRWRTPRMQDLLASRDDVIVHVRSALLQGLLATDDATLWPAVPGLQAASFIKALDAVAETLGRDSAADLCFAYVRAQPFVHGVVVGAETETQLAENAALFARPALDPDEVVFVQNFFPQVPEALLNPALWTSVRETRHDIVRAI